MTKIGYSFDPKKRLSEFNNSVRIRRKKGHLDSYVIFSQFFLIKLRCREDCKIAERLFLLMFKDRVLRQFGKEVVNIPPEKAAITACNLTRGCHAQG